MHRCRWCAARYWQLNFKLFHSSWKSKFIYKKCALFSLFCSRLCIYFSLSRLSYLNYCSKHPVKMMNKSRNERENWARVEHGKDNFHFKTQKKFLTMFIRLVSKKKVFFFDKMLCWNLMQSLFYVYCHFWVSDFIEDAKIPSSLARSSFSIIFLRFNWNKAMMIKKIYILKLWNNLCSQIKMTP